jgi:hypothetical protein
VTPAEEIAQALDNCALRIASGSEEPYEVIADASSRLASPTFMNSNVWLVLTWIADLMEDIRGPFSRAVSNSAARRFAQEWLALDSRLDERTQSAFLSRWVDDFSMIVESLPTPSQADRFEREASILAILGRNGMRSGTRGGRVRLPASLVDLAIEAWKRDELPVDREESPAARVDRMDAATLALIGRAALEGGTRDGDDVIVTLPQDVIEAAITAADR